MNNVKEGQTENTKITKKKKKLPGRSIYATSPKITIRIILTNLFLSRFFRNGVAVNWFTLPYIKAAFWLVGIWIQVSSRQHGRIIWSYPTYILMLLSNLNVRSELKYCSLDSTNQRWRPRIKVSVKKLFKLFFYM